MKLSAQFGFTLIELMVVIGLVAILSGAILPNFSTYINNQNRKQAQEQVKSDLRTIQNRALTGVGYTSTDTHWGIYFGVGSSTYSFLKIVGPIKDASTCIASTEKSNILPANHVIRTIPDPLNTNAFCVFFSFDNGDMTWVTDDGSVKTDCATNGPSPCNIYIGTPTGTTCSLVGLNSAGLIINNSETTCP
jgi:prepilin-type N-terminal cleavage/methylation domain-containing protein